jgi:hypothetical protein
MMEVRFLVRQRDEQIHPVAEEARELLQRVIAALGGQA